jgi:Ser/Thr protein kinase RdoA (MazF antagonist)
MHPCKIIASTVRAMKIKKFEQLCFKEQLTTQLNSTFSDDVRVDFCSYSVNHNYVVTMDNKKMFCRVYRPDKETIHTIKAEHELLFYLAEQGCNVAVPLGFGDGTTVKILTLEKQEFYYSLFKYIEGKIVPRDEWDLDFVNKWGRTLGELHGYCKLLSNTVQRPQWTQQQWSSSMRFFDDHILKKEDQKILKTELEQIRLFLGSFPSGNEYFGLVHYDFHPGNLISTEKGLSIIDFDDSCYHWYAWDFAMPLHRIGAGHMSDKNQDLKKEFIKGYKTQTDLPVAVEKSLKSFERIRHFYMLSWLFGRKDEQKWMNIYPRYLKRHIEYLKECPLISCG